MKRRDFGRAGLTGLASGLAFCGESTGQDIKKATAKKETPKPYGIQYYEKACKIWDRLSTSELPLITQAADKAASSLKNGKKLYCQLIGGHMLEAEFREDRPGNPNYFIIWDRFASAGRDSKPPDISQSIVIKDEDFNKIGNGDFLIFDLPKEQVRDARKRGAFTVGIRVPYFPNKTTPKGVLASNDIAAHPLFKDVILPEDCSDIILTTGIPFTDGVLYIPEIPAVRVSPISPQGTIPIFWMLVAEIAMRDKGGGRMGSNEKAHEYIEHIKERGAKIISDFDNIDTIARAMVQCVSQGGRYWNYTFSDGQPIMEYENVARTGGLVMIRKLDPKNIAEKGKSGDFVIIAGEASDIRENVEAARAFKNAGIKVIYIGPKTEGSSDNDLVKHADWHIDTFSPEREGALTVPGFDRKLCPTTGVLYPLAQYILNSQFVAYMIEADMTPCIYIGLHVIGAAVFNDLISSIVEKRGY